MISDKKKQHKNEKKRRNELKQKKTKESVMRDIFDLAYQKVCISNIYLN